MNLNSNESILLDSTLISKYKGVDRRILYDVKIVKCGDYIHIYKFSNTRSKINKRDEDKKINIKLIDTDNLTKISNSDSEVKSILLSNAIRSNLNCQRIAKSNRDVWETFITLTFKENLKDIVKANKIFNAWVSNVRKLKKDFKYIAVPEFQKRGAVHYHVLSNLGREDTKIIYLQQDRFGNAKDLSTIYDVKYWSKGFARVDFIKSDYKKIYGYICKYMTKDIDNKLFGKHRYFNSQNLIKPQTEYLNLSKKEDYDYFLNLINNKCLEYNSIYKDVYSDNQIIFYELL